MYHISTHASFASLGRLSLEGIALTSRIEHKVQVKMSWYSSSVSQGACLHNLSHCDARAFLEVLLVKTEAEVSSVSLSTVTDTP